MPSSRRARSSHSVSNGVRPLSSTSKRTLVSSNMEMARGEHSKTGDRRGISFTFVRHVEGIASGIARRSAPTNGHY
jgi:hypothetical protein